MIQKDSRRHVALPDGAIHLPGSGELDISTIRNWTDYGIWGLLLYDDQSPWFTLIECMHILFHLQRTSPEQLFNPPKPNLQGQLVHEVVQYEVPLNWNLRNLLFREVGNGEFQWAASGNLGSTEQWQTFVNYAEQTLGLHSLSYLSEAFEDVQSLHRALDLLRSTEVETYSSKKRWTSRHLLPLGPDTVFADVRENKHNRTGDRRFMRRTGEILYLMLGRSSQEIRDTLSRLLRDRLLAQGTHWNQLARLIRMPRVRNSSNQETTVKFSTGYLPFPILDVYNRLAQDWVSLLSLKQMPIENILDPLMRLSALHQVIYIIYRAQETKGLIAEIFPPFVFDLAGSARRNPVQRLAADQYAAHVKIPREAIDAYIDAFAESSYWRDLTSTSLQARHASTTLQDMFLWPKGRGANDVPDTSGTPAERLANFRADALSNTAHSIWRVITNHTKGAGMVLARPGVGTWYAPDDTFLEALVLANVREPLELGEFLRRLFRRYRIVIGQEQAQAAFRVETMPLERLKNNEHRLEERLRILGFVDRKSDACAFVVNPFYEQSDE